MDKFLRYEKNNILIIRPEKKDRVPLNCPVCRVAFGTRDDVLCYNINECCKDCDLTFRIPNLKKWNKGWRPNID